MRGLLPIYDFIDLDYTAQVKKIKDTYYVVFNRAREKFIVKDVDMHGTHYIAMIVQEENGKFRPFDERTLEGLRKVTQRGPNVKSILAELDEIALRKSISIDKDADDIQYGMNSDFKWAGSDITPSTAWRDRSWRR